MLTRTQGALAASVVAILTAGLAAFDVTDRDFRAWWAARALTTDVVSGLLVLLITLLVVDQLVRRREIADRSRAVGAQVALVGLQANRATAAVAAALDGSASEDAAEEVRSYTMMLLVVAPLLIEERASRSFLEKAQRLAGEMERALRLAATAADPSTFSRTRLDDAAVQLHAAAEPLMHPLDLKAFFAADAEAAP